MTCRVLKLARQPYYRWLADPVTDADSPTGAQANALFDAQADDPEFGYRYLVEAPATPGRRWPSAPLADLFGERWWTRSGKRGKNGKVRAAGARRSGRP